MSKARKPAGRRRFGSGIVDRYLLGLVVRPLALSLGVVMIALLLERVLRLVNILAATGSNQYGILAALTASLVPHYLGLALAAAFVVALFVAMIQLGDASELDALLGSGLSIWRITLPYLWLGGGLAVLSLALYGFLNPVSRYDYRRILYSALNTVGHSQVPPGTFVNAGNGLTITADTVDATGRRLEGVFIQQRRGESEKVTTARSGELAVAEDGKRLKLILEDGVSIRENEGQAPITTQFKRLNFDTQFDIGGLPFRARGDSERELTFPELWRQIRAPAGSPPTGGPATGGPATGGLKPAVLQAELIDRIARSLSFLFLPLLAVPLSLASRRGSRVTGLVFAAIILVVFNNALQLGKDLAGAGHGPPMLTAALPFLVFAGLSVWLFVSGSLHPAEAPLVRVFERVSALTAGLGRRLAAIRGRNRDRDRKRRPA